MIATVNFWDVVLVSGGALVVAGLVWLQIARDPKE